MIGKLSKRDLLRGTFGALALGASGCGWILYPERKGRTGGSIDTPIMVVDLLWLIPGIIPGVIFLIVDFTTGCIYKGSGSAANERQPGAGQATASLDVNGSVVAGGAVHAGRRAHLLWNRRIDGATVMAKGRLVVRRSDGMTAQALVSDLI